MARDEADREDLVKEAIAYVVRGEFTLPNWEQPVFIGFRTSGRFSFYFGSEPVYQFDARGRLRRAFLNGKLYRSEGTTLSEMQRQRSETETTLQRTDLSSTQAELFCWGMHEAIRQLEEMVENNHYETRAVVGGEDVWIEKIKQACQTVLVSQEFLAPKLVDR